MKKLGIIIGILTPIVVYVVFYLKSSHDLEVEMDAITELQVQCDGRPNYDIQSLCARVERLEEIPIVPGFASRIQRFQELKYILLKPCFFMSCERLVIDAQDLYVSHVDSVNHELVQDSVLSLEEAMAISFSIYKSRKQWPDIYQAEFAKFIGSDTALYNFSNKWARYTATMPTLREDLGAPLSSDCPECIELFQQKFNFE